MRFVRKIKDVGRWEKFVFSGDRANPPTTILNEFLDPDGQLSVYAATDEASAEKVAAALAFGHGGAPSRVILAFCENESLEKLKLKPIKSAGDTISDPINDLHYHLEVTNINGLIDVVKSFTVECYEFGPKVVAKAMADIANANGCDYSKLAGARENNWRYKSWHAFAHLAAQGLTEFRAPVT